MDASVQMLAILKKTYPNPRHYLRFSGPLELLVASILSAQVRDEVVNSRTVVLFKKYTTAQEYADADLATLEKEVYPITFYRNKARFVKEACRLLVERHSGEVPHTMAELTALPGIARKTANAILQNAFGIVEGVVVDTHVIRLSQRLGLSEEKDPVKIERDLMKLPKEFWPLLPYLCKTHGRAVCVPGKPTCGECVIQRLCPKVGV